mgnify:CR=1 FL=1
MIISREYIGTQTVAEAFVPIISEAKREWTWTWLNKAESGFLRMYLKNQQMEKIIIWPQPQGSMTPLDLIKPEQLYLPAYKWYSDLRPVSPEDIFRKPEVKIEVVEEKKHRFNH